MTHSYFSRVLLIKYTLLSNYLLSRLQEVQNSAATLVFKARKLDHAPPLLHAFHWLFVYARIDYKLLTICHNFFFDLSTAYFSDLLTVYTPFRQLHSSEDTWILCILHVSTKTFSQCCFFNCAPKLWNSLPSDIHHTQSSHAF